MRELPLDDLPAHSPWPARLLGLDDWAEQTGHGGTGVAAYEEIYEQLLGLARENPGMDLRDVKQSANHYAEESPVAISRDESLYLADVDEKQELQDEALVAAFDGVLGGGETVVALGCGWGYELGVLAEAYTDCEFVGGEPAESGVTLARDLLGGHDRIAVESFDFRDDRWDLLERVLTDRDGEDVVLFTQGSLTAIPSVREIIEGTLVRYLGRVREGVHLEHVCELHPEDTLLGQLRRSYVDRRGYNDDLLDSLREVEGLDVTGTTYDVVGGNPLHPLSKIRWEPA